MGVLDMGFFSKTAKNYLFSDKRGIVLIITALLMIPMMILVGVSIDFSRVQSARRLLQSGMDAAVIALAKQTNFADLEQSEAENIARSYILSHLSNFKGAELENLAVAINTTNETVDISADVRIGTTFLAVVGNDTIKAAVNTTAVREGNLEVVMVLDNSGSMGTKLKLKVNMIPMIFLKMSLQPGWML